MQGVAAGPDRRPSETAYVLAASATTEGETVGAEAAERWSYCGVARWDDTDNLWALPAVTFDIWRQWGIGRSCSRRLPPDAETQARSAIAALFSAAVVPTEAGERWVEAEGRRCRILGLSANNGVRMDGGPGGFSERVVSVTDIAWVLAARDDVRQKGGLLDEARVNRLRYLEGSPKASTRWIDTRWALALVRSIG